MPRVHLRIGGTVQGVGFRAATRLAASAHGLTGWVRNCPDGTVEAEFEGAESALESIRAWCAEGPRVARVREILELPPTSSPAYTAFEIR
jgi:acylphosphatase